jgi:DNA-directed RNA polymerase subunit RPC12/RpoP
MASGVVAPALYTAPRRDTGMAHVIRREWKCDRCGKEWVNEIVLKSSETPDPKKVDALIVCPSCQHNYSLMGEPGHEIDSVKTLPKLPR